MGKKDDTEDNNEKVVTEKPDAVLKYTVTVESGDDFIVNLEGDVDLPLFLDPMAIHQSEVSFKKVFEALVVDPVKLQVQNTIRNKQQQIQAEEEEKELAESSIGSSDVFMLADTQEEKINTEEETIEDDQQQESTDDNSSEGREQRNPEQEHSDGEWDTPDPVSG